MRSGFYLLVEGACFHASSYGIVAPAPRCPPGIFDMSSASAGGAGKVYRTRVDDGKHHGAQQIPPADVAWFDYAPIR